MNESMHGQSLRNGWGAPDGVCAARRTCAVDVHCCAYYARLCAPGLRSRAKSVDHGSARRADSLGNGWRESGYESAGGARARYGAPTRPPVSKRAAVIREPAEGDRRPAWCLLRHEPLRTRAAYVPPSRAVSSKIVQPCRHRMRATWRSTGAC